MRLVAYRRVRCYRRWRTTSVSKEASMRANPFRRVLLSIGFTLALGAPVLRADNVPPIRPEQEAPAASRDIPAATREVKGKHADPTGATAQCKDGSYSHSQHRARTCKKHGGVAKWLDESGK
jgi:hypothetical protein